MENKKDQTVEKLESQSSPPTGIQVILREFKKDKLARGIEVGVTEDGVTLNFHVIVAYGVCISTVADNLISNVKYRVEEFSGMPVDKINIYIEGVRVID